MFPSCIDLNFDATFCRIACVRVTRFFHSAPQLCVDRISLTKTNVATRLSEYHRFSHRRGRVCCTVTDVGVIGGLPYYLAGVTHVANGFLGHRPIMKIDYTLQLQHILMRRQRPTIVKHYRHDKSFLLQPTIVGGRVTVLSETHLVL